MQITPATPSHIQEMHRIHTSAVRTTCQKCYTEEQVKVWLEGRTPEGYLEAINKGDMYIAEENGKMQGFGHAVPGEIVAIFVDPALHHKGVGKKLLEYGLKIALKDHKKVKIESTTNAEGFYKKHGFKKIKDGSRTIKGVAAPVVIMEYTVSTKS